MRRSVVVAALLVAPASAMVAVACGDELASDVPPDASADDRSVSSEEGVDAGLDVTDANDAASGFCAAHAGFFACEDFELGLPPTRGWQAFATPGLAISDDAGDQDGGRAGLVIIQQVDAGGEYARLVKGLAGGSATYHVELVAKVERVSGEVQVATLLLKDDAGASLSVQVLSQAADVQVTFCTNACESQTTAQTLASWTPITIDVSVSGAMRASVGDASM